MAILIEGLEMPEDGRYIVCITHDSGGGVHWVFQNQDTLEFLEHSGVTEVPSHGRLIDANVMKTKMVCSEYWEKVLIEWIDEQKTVIPAEEPDMDSFIRIFEEDDEEDGMDSFIRILKD